MRLMNDNDDQKFDRIIHLMKTDESYDAPEDAVRWSKNIFLSRAAQPKKSLVSRIVGVLQMDLLPNRAAFGERSASVSQARQMLFRAGEASVDLRIKATENDLNVKGQILGADFADAAIVIKNDAAVFKTRANELSEFAFAAVPKGIYELTLKSRTREIVLPNLDLS